MQYGIPSARPLNECTDSIAVKYLAMRSTTLGAWTRASSFLRAIIHPHVSYQLFLEDAIYSQDESWAVTDVGQLQGDLRVFHPLRERTCSIFASRV
jgi:hypothetical protein